MATTKPTELAIPTTTDGIRALLQRAAKGDTATLPAIRKVLENPVNIELFGATSRRALSSRL